MCETHCICGHKLRRAVELPEMGHQLGCAGNHRQPLPDEDCEWAAGADEAGAEGWE